MPYKFSPSSLSLLKECPRCFWLAFNKDIKRPDTIFPSLPSGMDGVLKRHFDSFMEKGELPPSLSGLKGHLTLFNDVELLKVWRSNFKGIHWTDAHGNILRGAVDNILQKGKKLIVLDYKTRGFPLKEDTAAHYQDQLNIYTFLLQKNGYRTEDHAYLLFYYPRKVDEQGNVEFNTSLVKMMVSIDDVKALFHRALEVLKGDLPSASEECSPCQWVREN